MMSRHMGAARESQAAITVECLEDRSVPASGLSAESAAVLAVVDANDVAIQEVWIANADRVSEPSALGVDTQARRVDDQPPTNNDLSNETNDEKSYTDGNSYSKPVERDSSEATSTTTADGNDAPVIRRSVETRAFEATRLTSVHDLKGSSVNEADDSNNAVLTQPTIATTASNDRGDGVIKNDNQPKSPTLDEQLPSETLDETVASIIRSNTESESDAVGDGELSGRPMNHEIRSLALTASVIAADAQARDPGLAASDVTASATTSAEQGTLESGLAPRAAAADSAKATAAETEEQRDSLVAAVDATLAGFQDWAVELAFAGTIQANAQVDGDGSAVIAGAEQTAVNYGAQSWAMGVACVVVGGSAVTGSRKPTKKMARSMWKRMTTRLLSRQPVGPDNRRDETGRAEDTHRTSSGVTEHVDSESHTDWIRIKSDVAIT